MSGLLETYGARKVVVAAAKVFALTAVFNSVVIWGVLSLEESNAEARSTAHEAVTARPNCDCKPK